MNIHQATIKLDKTGSRYILRSPEGKVGFIIHQQGGVQVNTLQLGQVWKIDVVQDGEQYFKARLVRKLEESPNSSPMASLKG